MPLRTLVALTLASALVSACGGGDSETSPSPPGAPYSQTDERVGTGTEVTAGRTATVNYSGWLYAPTQPEQKGTLFDSSTSPGRTPFVFAVGTANVIRGWHQGVPGMRVGGLRRLVLPPELAYGSAGSPPAIPPNSTLVFDIELLAVQ